MHSHRPWSYEFNPEFSVPPTPSVEELRRRLREVESRLRSAAEREVHKSARFGLAPSLRSYVSTWRDVSTLLERCIPDAEQLWAASRSLEWIDSGLAELSGAMTRRG